ncbi:flavin reductase family protein [Variovorax fucosicus]|uniref:flavin reductase family protein n=1 Tax=Variovorax fucosicus TaxID=3053517 RepID=UPI002577AE55|nr:flavin reductase family protein [Variovorax sp. J22G47]MDM0058836.1 flavin reductase family protein [Variovorax sp. J22G47]
MMQTANTAGAWDDAHDGGLTASTFRQALGRFGSGVTVISVARGDGHHAMTANAFMSISLDPPLIAISVARKARINEYLVEGARFGISVLTDSQQPLALHFGGRPDSDLLPVIEWQKGVPLMGESAATFVAEVHQIHEGGDHRIFVAKVLQLRWREAAPLLFWGGGFGEFMARRPAPGGFLPHVPDFWC